jgi:putative transposase
MDLFSRKIVGWAMSENIDSALVQSAMKMALLHRRPGDGLIHHSDRGVQYAAGDFHDLLEDNNVVCSMSRKGNCWDNACVESFFASLKTERVRGKIYESFEDAKKDIFNYIEVFYNRKRRHASLGYVSPVIYEEMHEMKQNRAA